MDACVAVCMCVLLYVCMYVCVCMVVCQPGGLTLCPDVCMDVCVCVCLYVCMSADHVVRIRSIRMDRSAPYPHTPYSPIRALASQLFASDVSAFGA